MAFFGVPAGKSQKSPTGRISPKSSDFRVRPPESGVSSARPGPADQGPLRAPRIGICQGFLRRSATENLFLSAPTGPEIFFRRTASEKFIFVSLRLDGKKNIFFPRRNRDGHPVSGRGKKINFFSRRDRDGHPVSGRGKKINFFPGGCPSDCVQEIYFCL